MAYTLRTDKTWSQTLDDLDETFRKWGGSYQVSAGIRPNRARNAYQTVEEATVILTYTKAGHSTTLVMAAQDRAVDNLRVLYLAVEALRMNDLRGISDVVRAAYAQLPAPKPTPSTDDPYQVLGVQRDAPLAVVEAAWKAGLKTAHPDYGGSDAAAARLNAAMDTIRNERKQ